MPLLLLLLLVVVVVRFEEIQHAPFAGCLGLQGE
jgi:hypothetical protein